MSSPTSARPRRQSPKRPEDRLNDLLDASVEVFGQLGLETATVADITARAGVAKGTFYLYFPSKDHVLGVLWGRYVDGFLERADHLLSGPVGADQDWLPVLDRIVDSLIRHGIAHADLHRMVYRSANGRALEQCREGNERVIARLTEAVAQASAAGRIQVADPDLTTPFLYHGLHGLLADLIARAEPAAAGPAAAGTTAAGPAAAGPAAAGPPTTGPTSPPTGPDALSAGPHALSAGPHALSAGPDAPSVDPDAVIAAALALCHRALAPTPR